MKKKLAILLPLIAICLFFILKSSQHQTHQLGRTLGTSTLHTIETSSQVLVGRAIRSDAKNFTLSKHRHTLTRDHIEVLQKILLQDDAYDFEKSKKCLFTPEMVFQIGTEDPIYLFVNLFCHQVKFVYKERSTILDYDPVAPEFNSFCRDLLERLDEAKAP